jgi:glyoxylase-like metal-dependent hydrolase (beta-lactamase superfamily II)
MTQNRDTWEIIIIQHGTRLTMRSDVYMNYGFYNEPDDDFRLNYYLWVLRNQDQVILVDTGYSKEGAQMRGREVLIDPVEALSQLGINAADGHPVVVTHAHYDHIGNIGTFTHSPIHISRKELEFWTSDIATRPLFSHYGDQDEIADLVEAKHQGRLFEFDGHKTLASGVELIEVGGHTPGQLVVLVQTSVGPVILASDAAHFHEEIERDMLFQSMTDLPQSYRTLDWLRDQDVTYVVTGHDVGELERFKPIPDVLPQLAAIIGDSDA